MADRPRSWLVTPLATVWMPTDGLLRGLVALSSQRLRPAPSPIIVQEAGLQASTIIMYTTSWCADCRAAKRALDAAGLPYREIDIERDEQAMARLVELNDGRRSVPTLELGPVAASLSRFSPAKLDAFLRAAGVR